MAKSAREQLGVDLQEPDKMETADAIGVDEAEVSTRPEWLPEKFKDESEFANSYKNLESELGRRAEDQKRLEGQIRGLSDLVQGLQPQERQSSTSDSDLRAQLQENFENDPIGTMAYLAQQAADQTVESRLNTLQQQNDPFVRAQVSRDNELLAIAVDNILNKRHPDWDEYKEKVSDEIRNDPTLLSEQVLHSPELTARSLERVYTTIKAQDIVKQHEDGTYQSTRMKQQAQSLSGSMRRPGQQTAEEEQIDAILNAAKGMSYSSFRQS